MSLKIVNDESQDFDDLDTWIEKRLVTREQIENTIVLRWLNVDVFESVSSKIQFLDHRRGAESQVIAVADVDRRAAEFLT